MEDVRELQVFELTWVEYDPKDPLGVVLALFTLSPILLMISYFTLVLSQRDLDTIFMFVGQMLSVVLNKVLKILIKQPRPEGSRMGGSGMPSAHSHFIAFFAAYTVAYTWKRMNARRRMEQCCTIMGATAIAVLTCYSRVHLGYHSTEQVVVGAAFGVLGGFAWHEVGCSVSSWLFPIVAKSSIAKFFYVRDTSKIPDLTVYHYETCSSKAAAASPQSKSQ